MDAAAGPARDTGPPARELPSLAEHHALVEQLPSRLQGVVADGLITAEEANAWIIQADAVLAGRAQSARGPGRSSVRER